MKKIYIYGALLNSGKRFISYDNKEFEYVDLIFEKIKSNCSYAILNINGVSDKYLVKFIDNYYLNIFHSYTFKTILEKVQKKYPNKMIFLLNNSVCTLIDEYEPYGKKIYGNCLVSASGPDFPLVKFPVEKRSISPLDFIYRTDIIKTTEDFGYTTNNSCYILI